MVRFRVCVKVRARIRVKFRVRVSVRVKFRVGVSVRVRCRVLQKTRQISIPSELRNHEECL